MPRYRITDSTSGRTLLVEGAAPPTEADAEELFASAPAVAVAPPPDSANAAQSTAAPRWRNPYGLDTGRPIEALPPDAPADSFDKPIPTQNYFVDKTKRLGRGLAQLPGQTVEYVGQMADATGRLLAASGADQIHAELNSPLDERFAAIDQALTTPTPGTTLIRDTGREMRSSARDLYKGNYAPDPARDAELGAKVADNAASVAGALITPGGLVAKTITGAMLNSQGQSDEARQILLSRGATEKEADDEALRQFVLNLPAGALEAIPWAFTIKRFGGAKIADAVAEKYGKTALRRVSTAVFGQAATNASEEVLQNIWSNAAAKLTYDPTRTYTEGSGEAALVGSVLGGGVGGTLQTTAEIANARANRQKSNARAPAPEPDAPIAPDVGSVVPDQARPVDQVPLTTADLPPFDPTRSARDIVLPPVPPRPVAPSVFVAPVPPSAPAQVAPPEPLPAPVDNAPVVAPPAPETPPAPVTVPPAAPPSAPGFPAAVVSTGTTSRPAPLTTPPAAPEVKPSSRRQIAEQRAEIRRLTKLADQAAQSSPERAGQYTAQAQQAREQLAEMESNTITGPTPQVGPDPLGNADLLTQIADYVGKINMTPPANSVGGEYDGLAAAFSRGAARLLRSAKGGTNIVNAITELNAAAGTKFESPSQFFEAVDRAVSNRQNVARDLDRQAYRDKVEGMAQTDTKKGRPRALVPSAPNVIDQVGVGGEFKLNKEKFSVVDTDEGPGGIILYIIQDGHRFTIPEGTPIYPDKGSLKIAEVAPQKPAPTGPQSDDPFGDNFVPEPDAPAAAPTPGTQADLVAGIERQAAAPALTLESASVGQQAAEAQAAREAQLVAKRRADMLDANDQPLTGDSSNVNQGQLYAEDADMFSGASAQEMAAPPAALDNPGQAGRVAEDAPARLPKPSARAVGYGGARAVISELENMATESVPAYNREPGGRLILDGNAIPFLQSMDVFRKTLSISDVVDSIATSFPSIDKAKIAQRLQAALDGAEEIGQREIVPFKAKMFRGETGRKAGETIGESWTSKKEVAASYGPVSESEIALGDVLKADKKYPSIEPLVRGSDAGEVSVKDEGTDSSSVFVTGRDIIEHVSAWLRDQHGVTSPLAVSKYLKNLGWDGYAMSDQLFVFDPANRLFDNPGKVGKVEEDAPAPQSQNPAAAAKAVGNLPGAAGGLDLPNAQGEAPAVALSRPPRGLKEIEAAIMRGTIDRDRAAALFNRWFDVQAGKGEWQQFWDRKGNPSYLSITDAEAQALSRAVTAFDQGTAKFKWPSTELRKKGGATGGHWSDPGPNDAEAGRIDPQLLFPLARAVVGGIAGYLEGDTPEEKLAYALAGGLGLGLLGSRRLARRTLAALTPARAPVPSYPFDPGKPLRAVNAQGVVVGSHTMGALEHVRAIEMPELVHLARQLSGNDVGLRNFPKASGKFKYRGTDFRIELDRRIFSIPSRPSARWRTSLAT